MDKTFDFEIASIQSIGQKPGSIASLWLRVMGGLKGMLLLALLGGDGGGGDGRVRRLLLLARRLPGPWAEKSDAM